MIRAWISAFMFRPDGIQRRTSGSPRATFRDWSLRPTRLASSLNSSRPWLRRCLPTILESKVRYPSKCTQTEPWISWSPSAHIRNLRVMVFWPRRTTFTPTLSASLWKPVGSACPAAREATRNGETPAGIERWWSQGQRAGIPPTKSSSRLAFPRPSDPALTPRPGSSTHGPVSRETSGLVPEAEGATAPETLRQTDRAT